MARRIVIVALPACAALDVVGPYEVFAGAREGLQRRGARDLGYEPMVVGIDNTGIPSESGLGLQAHGSLAQLVRKRAPLHTLLIAGGSGARAAVNDRRVLRWVQLLAARAERVASVCTGAFVLAAAGLLDGRRATTHWAYCRQLAESFPRVKVEPDPIYIEDGRIWTSAGVTAGMDLALAMVERDCGHALSAAVARHYVMFIRRAGGQSQFSPHLTASRAHSPSLRELHDFISEHPGEQLDVPSLAKRAGMSVRNFSRRFRAELGVPPAAYIERVRLEHARALLEDSTHGIDEVATRAGFGQAETLRRVFARHIGLSPREYRARFRKRTGT
ncbi:MAG: GlxA family transcriptional regulator [Polyangiales bacterium]